MKSVLFVCHGNICRSQMGHMMFLDFLKSKNIDNIKVDSAAVSTEEIGNTIDYRAKDVLQAHNVPIIKHRARLITKNDIESFDLILVMTYSQYKFLERFENGKKNVYMFNEFVKKEVEPSRELDIADPWYGDESAFEQTYSELKAGLKDVLEFLT